jgi:hypothetical protein
VLIDAPGEFWEREGVLRFTGAGGEGAPGTAWRQVVGLLGCGNTTAKKALDWMHGQGVIGYYAGKNGAGIRIFINRASSSIGRRVGQKNLRLVGTPTQEARTPSAGTPFSDSFAVLEVLEKDLNPRAPENGAGPNADVNKLHDPRPTPSPTATPRPQAREAVGPHTAPRPGVPVEEIVSRLKRELGPALQSVARQAAAQEHERTREWLESKGLPKAARVAQREAYDVLRRHGLISASTKRADPGSVGVRQEPVPAEAGRLSAEEARALAETCVAMLEVHGQGIDSTLAQLGAEVGGPLLAEDVPRVRELALILAGGGRRE